MATAPLPATSYGHSRWAVAAAAVLLGLGVLAVGAGSVLVFDGLTRDDSDQMGYGTLAAVIGGVIAAFGGAQVASAIGIWRHAAWARYVGLALAAVGAIVGGVVLPTAFNTVYVAGAGFGEIVAAGPNPTSITIGLSFFPSLFVVIGLALGGRHFRA